MSILKENSISIFHRLQLASRIFEQYITNFSMYRVQNNMLIVHRTTKLHKNDTVANLINDSIDKCDNQLAPDQ